MLCVIGCCRLLSFTVVYCRLLSLVIVGYCRLLLIVVGYCYCWLLSFMVVLLISRSLLLSIQSCIAYSFHIWFSIDRDLTDI